MATRRRRRQGLPARHAPELGDASAGSGRGCARLPLAAHEASGSHRKASVEKIPLTCYTLRTFRGGFPQQRSGHDHQRSGARSARIQLAHRQATLRGHRSFATKRTQETPLDQRFSSGVLIFMAAPGRLRGLSADRWAQNGWDRSRIRTNPAMAAFSDTWLLRSSSRRRGRSAAAERAGTRRRHAAKVSSPSAQAHALGRWLPKRLLSPIP